MSADGSNLKAMFALALGMLVIIFIPELAAPGFYYADDVRHYFMPHIMEIGTRLNHGEMPWITLRSWFSGDFVGDGLLSIGNPVNLMLYWICAAIGDPAQAALFFSSVYLYLTAGAVYWLAQTYGAQKRYAVLAALAYCSSAYVMYWHAASWWNSLIGTCWMLWAWAGWRCFIRERQHAFTAYICTLFLLVSGWPQGVIMTLLIVLVDLYFERQRFSALFSRSGRVVQDQRRNAMRHAASILLLAACAAASSLVVNYPAYLHAAESARASWGIHQGTDWVGSLDYLAAAGWPSFIPSQRVFFGRQSSLPFFYLAWFVPPVLLLCFCKGIWEQVKVQALPLLVVAVIAFLISLGPQQLYMLRWPLRFLTFAHVALVIAACIALPCIRFRGRCEAAVPIAYAATGFVVSSFVAPLEWRWHVVFSCMAILAAMALSSKWCGERLKLHVLCLFLLLIHVFFHLKWTQNENVGDWPVPTFSHYPELTSSESNSRAVLMPSAVPCWDGRCVFASGNIGMWETGRALNGYSPVGQRAYHQTFGFNLWSWTAPAKLTAYFALDPASGLPLYRLMRIDEFRVIGEKILEQFNRERTGAWCTSPVQNGMLFKTKLDMTGLPGTVSWISPGMDLGATQEGFSLNESIMLLTNRLQTEPGKVVFARAWYPGYIADIDGQQLKVEKYADFLVSVVVPAGLSGKITLQYRPAGFGWSVPLAMMCTIVAACIALCSARASVPDQTE